MPTLKQKFSHLIALFGLSSAGVVTYAVIISVILAIHNGPTLQQLLNPLSELHVGSQITHWLDVVVTTLFGSHTGSAALAFFWVFVGILVCIMVSAIINSLSEMEAALHERRYVRPAGSDPNSPLKNLLSHGLFHLAMFILFMLYAVQVVKYLPAYLPTSFKDLANSSIGHLAITNLVFILVTALILHIGVCMLRLLTLRHRLLG